MPKTIRNTDPVDRAAYEATMARIVEITGASTQCQLAEILDVRQSSISDAKRRASVPADWVLKLHKSHRAMPQWILEGEGPRTLDDIIPHEVRQTAKAVREVRAEIGRMADLIRESVTTARATVEDIITARTCAMETLTSVGQSLEVYEQQTAALAQSVPGESAGVAQ